MVKRFYTNMSYQEKQEIKREQNGTCAICFSDDVIGNAFRESFKKDLCKGCNDGLELFQNDWDTLLRAACYVIVHKAGMSDLRIGYKLLFEEARKQEERRLEIIRKKAKEQLCQQKQELLQEP